MAVRLDTPSSRLAEFIVQSREQAGLKQNAAAEAAGRSVKWLWDRENGGVVVKVDDLLRMQVAWGLDVNTALQIRREEVRPALLRAGSSAA